MVLSKVIIWKAFISIEEISLLMNGSLRLREVFTW